MRLNYKNVFLEIQFVCINCIFRSWYLKIKIKLIQIALRFKGGQKHHSN